MTNDRRSGRLRAVLLGIALLAVFGALGPAQAQEEPALVIRRIEGQTSAYLCADIEQIYFDEGEMVVSHTMAGGGTVGYPITEIVRLELNPHFSDVQVPENQAVVNRVLHLFQNRPNPFTPMTRIDFELPRAGSVELAIYSPDGRKVRSLVKGERPAGHHEVTWDGLDEAGLEVPGGVYFYALVAPGISESRQMILIP